LIYHSLRARLIQNTTIFLAVLYLSLPDGPWLLYYLHAAQPQPSSAPHYSPVAVRDHYVETTEAERIDLPWAVNDVRTIRVSPSRMGVPVVLFHRHGGLVHLLRKVADPITLSCHRLVAGTQEAAQEATREEEWDQEAVQNLVEVQIQVVQHLAEESLIAGVD